jgi:hypothetical protein
MITQVVIEIVRTNWNRFPLSYQLASCLSSCTSTRQHTTQCVTCVSASIRPWHCSLSLSCEPMSGGNSEQGGNLIRVNEDSIDKSGKRVSFDSIITSLPVLSRSFCLLVSDAIPSKTLKASERTPQLTDTVQVNRRQSPDGLYDARNLRRCRARVRHNCVLHDNMSGRLCQKTKYRIPGTSAYSLIHYL